MVDPRASELLAAYLIDVDVQIVARGTPGMSGADLSNLVNEAALFAVRRGAHEIHREDFDAARDRVLMGLKRESLALSVVARTSMLNRSKSARGRNSGEASRSTISS